MELVTLLLFLNSAKLIQSCTNNSTQKMKNISKKRIQKSFYPNYTQRATTFSIQKFNEQCHFQTQTLNSHVILNSNSIKMTMPKKKKKKELNSDSVCNLPTDFLHIHATQQVHTSFPVCKMWLMHILPKRGVGISCLYSTLRHQNGNLYSFFPHQYSISLYKNVLFNQILQIQLYSLKEVGLVFEFLMQVSSLALHCQKTT